MDGDGVRGQRPVRHEGGQMLRFAQKPITAVTKADIEAIRAARRVQTAVAGRPGSGEVGINRLLERCRHLFAWAIQEGFTEVTPFRRHGQVVIKLTKETARSRRLSGHVLDDDEEARLLKSAGPHLQALIVAATSTGCRLGELLSLQWKDVRVTTTPQGQTRQSFVLHAHKTKTATTREVPVGSRLAAVLDLRRHAPDGVPFGPDGYVFGNTCGEHVVSIKKAWQTTVLKAHGHVPQWVKGTRNHLAPESQAAYRAINLHFHDLRREFGSRVLESGSSLVEARDLLGHANISQTSTYLQSTAKSLGLAIEKKEQYERDLVEARRRQVEEQAAAAQASALPGGNASCDPLLDHGPERVQ